MNNAAYNELKAATGNVSHETFERLLTFEQRFRSWNSRINLVAQSTLDDLWRRHIVDSAQLIRLKPKALHWLDLGSGGGFPGLIVAFLLAEKPGGHIDLVESSRKKAAFLQTIIGEFDLPAKVHAVRIADVANIARTAEVVTARALAELDDLLALASPWITEEACALFHKGRDYRTEIAKSAHRWQFDLIEHRSMTDAQAVILEVAHLRPATE